MVLAGGDPGVRRTNLTSQNRRVLIGPTFSDLEVRARLKYFFEAVGINGYVMGFALLPTR